jgi:hypothetical protein
MKDACGFPITDGFYTDSQIFHYYHVKETPKGLMKRETNEREYSLLDPVFASYINRVIRQEELVKLILSVEKGLDEELEEEIRTGILGKMPHSQS